MKKYLLCIIFFLFLVNNGYTQTFNGVGGAIPDSGNGQRCFPINVSGIGNINSTYGLGSVCLSIAHNRVSDLEVFLRSPAGTTIPISVRNGGAGIGYSGTCFSGNAATSIENGISPFTGNFIPDGYLGVVNNGQTADGIWQLCINDVVAGETGALEQCSINFTSSLPPSPPICNNNPIPASNCSNAPFVCSLFGFCAATSLSYSADTWPELTNAFCGTIQNNAFVKFVATSVNMDFNVWVMSSTQNDGIQMFFFEANCGSGPVIDHGCYSPIFPGLSPNIVTATDLVPGNTYYLMIDGFAGDECNYIIEPLPASGALTLTSSATSICTGSQVQLTATGGNGNYSWNGIGLNSYTGNTVVATIASTQVYTVTSIDPGGSCPVTKQINIAAVPLSPLPVATDSIIYCQNFLAPALTATGSTLLWYDAAFGGAGSAIPPVPSTKIDGSFVYYVSQNTGSCESNRTTITVIVNKSPQLGPDIEKKLCTGLFTDLTLEFNSRGYTSNWQFESNNIAPPVSVNQPGNYRLEVTNIKNCADTASVNLLITQPIQAFAGNDTVAVRGVPIQLHCSHAESYNWSPAAPLNRSNIQSPVATLFNDQQFVVQTEDRAGCKSIDTINVKMINATGYQVPSAFTPNTDGLNDVFKPIAIDISNTESFHICDRFGTTIYQNNNLTKGWDGTSKQVKLPAGTYVWFIKGTDKYGKKISVKGTVVLIR